MQLGFEFPPHQDDLLVCLRDRRRNLRLGRIWVRRQQRKHHPEQGPVISPAMRQAAQTRQRTMGGRRRQEREKAARARGRPPD